MADNVTMGGTTAIVATEDFAGAHFQRVLLGTGADLMWAGTATVTGTTDFALQAAPGDGTCLWVTHISYLNAGTVETVLSFKNNSTIAHFGYTDGTKGQGAAYTIQPGWRLTANAPLNVAAATTGGTVYVNAIGFKGP